MGGDSTRPVGVFANTRPNDETTALIELLRGKTSFTGSSFSFCMKLGGVGRYFAKYTLIMKGASVAVAHLIVGVLRPRRESCCSAKP